MARPRKDAVATTKTEEHKVTVTAEKEVKKVEKPKAKPKIPLDLEVPVVNNTPGTLIYISRRSGGMNASWGEYGDIQYLDIRELISMRNTDKRFFTDNWIGINGSDDGEFTADDIYKYLRVDNLYTNYIPPERIDEFFGYEPEEMASEIADMTPGMRDVIITELHSRIASGSIDSVSKISALEKAFGMKFTEE